MNENFAAELFFSDIASHPLMAKFDENQIFIDPDLYYEKKNEQISNLKQLVELCKQEKAIIFAGADRSGKTLLAKKLQFELTNEGFSAVRVAGRSIRNADFPRLIRRAIVEQLEAADFSLHRTSVIIDDFDECGLGDRTKEELVKYLVGHCEKAIMFSFSNAPSVFFASNSLPEPAVININAMTDDKILRLVYRWKFAGTSEQNVPTDTAVLASYERLQLIFDQTEVGRSPCFAVQLLQLIETLIGSDITISSHAACYDVMISQRLVGCGIDWKSVDECKNFLSFVAYKAYVDTGTGCLDKEAFEECITIFREQFLSSEKLLRQASVGGFIEYIEADTRFVFKEEYIWFFLCARYVVQVLQVQDRSKYVQFIETCTRNIFQKKFANIVIYVSYFATDDFVVSSLLEILDGLFSKADRWILSDDSREIMMGLAPDQNLIVMIEPEEQNLDPTSDNFEKKLDLLREKVMDVINDVRSVVARYTLPFLNPNIEDSVFVEDMDIETASADSYMRNVNALLRIHSIIGQILNSRPGTFSASFILNCITRMVRASGRYAALNHAIATVLVYEQAQEKKNSNVAKSFPPSSNISQEEQYKKVVRTFAFWSVYLSHAGLARYLSQEHAIRALAILTNEHESEKQKSSQGNIPFNFTIVMTIARLYYSKSVDRREIDGVIQKYGQHSAIMNLLRVAFHIYTYYMELPYDDKQWLSDKLHMSLSKLEVQRIKATEKHGDRKLGQKK